MHKRNKKNSKNFGRKLNGKGLLFLKHTGIIIHRLFLKGGFYCESSVIRETNLRKVQNY